MKLTQSLILAGVGQAVAAAVLMASSPVSAAQLYNFSYSGSFLIAGITGERNGVAISSLLPVGSYPTGPDLTPNDNLFFPNQDIQLTFAGLSFQTADGNKYNPFYDADLSSYRECSLNCDEISDVTFTSTAVPEPASVLGLVAFGALGATLKGKKKLAAQKVEA